MKRKYTSADPEVLAIREMLLSLVKRTLKDEEYLLIDEEDMGLLNEPPPGKLTVRYSHLYSGGCFNWAFTLHFGTSRNVTLIYDSNSSSGQLNFDLAEPKMPSLCREVRYRLDIQRKYQDRTWPFWAREKRNDRKGH